MEIQSCSQLIGFKRFTNYHCSIPRDNWGLQVCQSSVQNIAGANRTNLFIPKVSPCRNSSKCHKRPIGEYSIHRFKGAILQFAILLLWFPNVLFCDGGSLLLADFLFSDFDLQLFDCTVFCLEHRIRMCYKFHSVETSLTSINLVYLVYKIGLVFLYIAVKDTKQA